MTSILLAFAQDAVFINDEDGRSFVGEFVGRMIRIEQPKPKTEEVEAPMPLKEDNTDLLLLREEAVERYSEHFTTTYIDKHGVEHLLKPITICNNRELDHILTTAETWDDALRMMHDRIGLPGVGG